MSKIARVGDSHSGTCDHNNECCPHSVTGKIINGSPNVFINGKSVARNGDLVEHNCPHCGTGYINCSSSVKANGKSIAHIDNTVIYPEGQGTIISGSENVNGK